MWLEVKMLLSGVGVLFIIIGIILGVDGLTIVSFLLLFMGIGSILFGDLLIGYLITAYELKPQMDRTPPGKELTVFQEIGGGGRLHFINTTKDTMGQRKFPFHRKEAIVITDGRGMFTLPNGNRGFFSHENYDKNIEPARAQLYQDLEGENIKDIFKNILQKHRRKND